MLNQNIDELTKKLSEVHLDWTKIIEILGVINTEETELLKDIHDAAAIGGKNNHMCLDTICETVSINNYLHNEFDKTCNVVNKGDCMVRIRDSGIGKEYTRAWWNLKLVEPAKAATPTPKIPRRQHK